MKEAIRVVLVDDQELYREGNALLLDATDDIAVVGESGTGEEALQTIAEAEPDIVLMDIRMPGMGGIDATRRIVSAHPDIRVIALTIFDLDEYAFGALDAGASAFILKSSSPEALIRAVRIVASGEAVVEPRITRQLIDMYTRRIIPMPETDSEKGEPRRDIDSLSPREREVFYAIAQGLSNPEISDRFFLSLRRRSKPTSIVSSPSSVSAIGHRLLFMLIGTVCIISIRNSIALPL